MGRQTPSQTPPFSDTNRSNKAAPQAIRRGIDVLQPRTKPEKSIATCPNPAIALTINQKATQLARLHQRQQIDSGDLAVNI